MKDNIRYRGYFETQSGTYNSEPFYFATRKEAVVDMTEIAKGNRMAGQWSEYRIEYYLDEKWHIIEVVRYDSDGKKVNALHLTLNDLWK